jgi:hypothetical protein
MVCRRGIWWGFCRSPSRPMRLSQRRRFMPPLLELIEIEINNGCGVQSQQLGYSQTTDDCDSKRLTDFGAVTLAHCKRNRTKHCGQSGHHDGTKANNTGLVNCIGGGEVLVPLSFQREIDHHDGVFFHDADQENDSNDRDNERSTLKRRSASKAPKPAEGRVERIVIG